MINIPDRTAVGILEAMGPIASKTKSNITPAIIPESFVFPPEFILTTVLMVAPAPGMPPKMDAILFPIPCPISSLFGLCFVLVMLSATILVSSESIAPSRASVNPVNIYGVIVASLN